jgi:SAM-dependent methyltransferase
MHGSVLDWVSESLAVRKTFVSKSTGVNVLEVGSLDINGSVRFLFNDLISDGGSFFGIDVQEGPGVDLVADASVYKSEKQYDIVVCAEVFEHTAVWPKIVKNAYSLLTPGGMFIATMAGEGRAPHSAIDENPIRSWEYYKNVTGPDLKEKLFIFSDWEVNVKDKDTRCWAVK